jgi:hypothetical protein
MTMTMTKLIGLMITLAVIVSGAAAQDRAKAAPKPLARGDKVMLVATYGQVPVFINEQACKSYLVAAKSATPQAYETIRVMFDSGDLELIRSEEEATVENVDSLMDKDGKPKKLPPLDNIQNPILVPHVAIRLNDQDAPEWVPVFYLRQPSSKPYGVEARFPVLVGVDDFSADPIPGKVMYINNKDDSEIPLATNLATFDDMKKAIDADDQIGIRELTRNDSMKRIPSGSRAKVLEWHSNRFVRAVEVRFLDGPVKDQVWLVREQNTSIRSVTILPYQVVKNAVKAQPKKKR